MKTPNDDLPELARNLHLQVAIDGPAGAGKSTVGQAVARALRCAFIDTGLMYRAITELALRQNIPLADSRSLAESAKSIDFQLHGGNCPVLLIEGEPGGPGLRSRAVDAAVSEVSAHSEVRRIMVQRQRELAAGRCVVMVGRDIGTVVLPEADIKLWITASPQERGRRRAQENLPDSSADHQETVSHIVQRDAFDSERANSPLLKAEDATVIDTEELKPSQALEVALGEIRAAIDLRTTLLRSSPEPSRSS